MVSTESGERTNATGSKKGGNRSTAATGLEATVGTGGGVVTMAEGVMMGERVMIAEERMTVERAMTKHGLCTVYSMMVARVAWVSWNSSVWARLTRVTR